MGTIEPTFRTLTSYSLTGKQILKAHILFNAPIFTDTKEHYSIDDRLDRIVEACGIQLWVAESDVLGQHLPPF